MKIIILEKGFHGIEPMMVLLEEGQITNVQFLLHSEKEIKDEYESYCKTLHADPYEEDIATKYLVPWILNFRLICSDNTHSKANYL